MKSFIILIISLFICLRGFSQRKDFITILNKIYANNGGAKDRSTFKLSAYQKEARMKAYLADRSSFLKNPIDTLYLLEGYNIETATFYGTIFNRKEKLNYSYFRKNLTLQKQPVFTRYQVQLVTNWDTLTIRHGEKVNGNWLDNNLQINAIRCVRKGRSWQIDEIYFKDFFDPKLDK